MRILCYAWCLLLLLHCAAPQCRFATSFTSTQLFNDEQARRDFVQSVLYWEGKFNSNGAGLNCASGLTYDGHAIDYQTGELAEPLHYWSAPSKESIHLGMAAKALAGHHLYDPLDFFQVSCKGASALFNSGDARLDNVLYALQMKINTYERWLQEYPGYGGFIPWVYVNDTGMIPIPHEWDDKVPGLDNGEMIWGMYAVIQALSNYPQYSNLTQQYQNYFNVLKANAKMIFYFGDGKISAVTKIKNIYAKPTKDNYSPDGINNWLDDPYEGELLAVFLDLYASWSSDKERDEIWIRKRGKLEAVHYKTPKGKITVQKGWWFSSHEQWKYLMLPYQSVDINNRVFVNGERARTWNSFLNRYPGLFASVTNVTTPGNYPNYLSAAGIQEIAFQQVQTNDVLTPYGAYPLMLATPQPFGLVWYHAMISGPRMQGPYGSTESVNNEGTEICPVVTWDSKITTVLAMLGGVSDLNAKGLQKEGLLQRFTFVIDREWSMVFKGIIVGENLSFMPPSVSIPTNILGDFTSCTQ